MRWIDSEESFALHTHILPKIRTYALDMNIARLDRKLETDVQCAGTTIMFCTPDEFKISRRLDSHDAMAMAMAVTMAIRDTSTEQIKSDILCIIRNAAGWAGLGRAGLGWDWQLQDTDTLCRQSLLLHLLLCLALLC